MRDPISDLSLDELSVRDLAHYRDERLKVVKAGTVCRELGLVQHALNVATDEWGYDLEENPAAKVRKPKLNNARNRRVSQHELDRLVAELAELGRLDVISVIQFAVETGMRRGEILSLEWRFVDLKRRTAHLPRTKNGYARTVPLTNGAIAVLEQQVQHQRVTRAWFFAQDNGFYVQCKYGAKPLALSKDGNAVFVKQLGDVSNVLQAFYAAAAAGEFDSAIASAAKRVSKT